METRFNKVTASFLVLGLLLGFVFGYMVSKPDTDLHKEFADQIDLSAEGKVDSVLIGSEASGQNTPSDYVLDVADQVAGDTVLVSQVSLPAKSWLAVTDDNNGSPSYILGAQRVPAGVHSNIQVELLRSTLSGARYHLVIYVDDGDDMFDFRKDVLVTHSDGTELSEMFTAVN